MSTTTHVNISEVVREHFANTGSLPALVYDMNAGELEELVDAYPERERELVDSILHVLRG